MGVRPRVMLVAAGGLALAIGAYAVLSPTGLPRLWKLKGEEKSLAVEVDKTRGENAHLADEVKVLQGTDATSTAVLEKHAREQLGYVKADEVVLTGLPSGAVNAPKTNPEKAPQ